jgi:hypothetical protein
MVCVIAIVLALVVLFIVLHVQQQMVLQKEGFIEYIVYGPSFWHGPGYWWGPRRPWWRRRYHGWTY